MYLSLQGRTLAHNVQESWYQGGPCTSGYCATETRWRWATYGPRSNAGQCRRRLPEDVCEKPELYHVDHRFSSGCHTNRCCGRCGRNHAERRSRFLGWMHCKLLHDEVIRWKHCRVTGPLCGEFTGHRWIPLTKASYAELLCFLWYAPEQMAEQAIEMPVISDAIELITTSL